MKIKYISLLLILLATTISLAPHRRAQDDENSMGETQATFAILNMGSGQSQSTD